MYPRVVQMYQNDLRPALTGYVTIDRTGVAKDLTGIVSCKFWMALLDDLSVVKINGAAGVIVSAPLGQLQYLWTGTNTDTIGRYASWFVGYFGGGSTIPETYTGPEIVICTPGTRLVH